MQEGSPPHTRGILRTQRCRRAVCRFTPAYAGNTYSTVPFWQSSGVHPRIRGEYVNSINLNLDGVGSPPHTRGILEINEQATQQTGFTPAYAGNTAGACRRRRFGWVHPRIRGEYNVS